MRLSWSRHGYRFLPALLGLLCLQAQGADSTAPFVIAPMIEGFGFCAPPKEQKEAGMESPCLLTKELGKALDALEPRGARGKVQVGYTLGINMLNLGSQTTSRRTLADYTEALVRLQRPAVIYLMANHFAGESLKPGEADDSLERFADQTAPSERYFEGGITPLTPGLTPGLSITRKRLAALEAVGRWYKGLPPQARERIVAFTLAGELHHFFDGFASGPGKFDNIRVTDYSPQSVRDFQEWLRRKYRSIDALNATLNHSYGDFSEVRPPDKDIRKTPLKHIGEHFDSHAHGEVLLDGWLETLPTGHVVAIYLDGKKIGEADYGLNRQDVYEGVGTARTAGVGFRYRLDFRNLPRGRHIVQVLLEGRERLQLARRTLSIMGKSQAPIPEAGASLTVKAVPSSLKNWLDRPADDQAFFYNPLARDWLEFRSAQISNAYDAWYERAVAAGLPADKLYSHQIAAATIGGWNPVLTASDESLQGKRRYRKGINLYAGSASMALLRRYYLQPGETFGVPEFHTQSWKDPQAPLAVMRELRAGGATFVSPYFVSLVPARFRNDGNAHNKFRLAPDNTAYGSQHLYSAIRSLAEE